MKSTNYESAYYEIFPSLLLIPLSEVQILFLAICSQIKFKLNYFTLILIVEFPSHNFTAISRSPMPRLFDGSASDEDVKVGEAVYLHLSAVIPHQIISAV
jgi:hypothetical protein